VNNKIEIKQYQALPPINDLVDLAKTYYDSGEIISNDYLNWQYCQNPSGFPIYSLAFCEEKLIGQYFVIPINYLINGQKIKGTLSLNTLTHPDFQGKGIFTKLADSTYDLCEKENIKFTLGFPNPLSYGGFVKKLNFNHIGNASLLIQPLKPFSILQNFLTKKTEKHGGDIPFSWENFMVNNKNTRLLEKKDEILYNEFWHSLKFKKATIDKDFSYIKWRYLDIPKRKYYPIIVENNHKITAFCTVRVEIVMNIKTAVIMDSFLLPEHSKDMNILIKLLLKTLKKQGISMVTCLNPNEEIIKTIFKNKFFIKIPERFLPQPIPIILREHQVNVGIDLKQVNNWSFSFGDYDIF